MKYSRCFLLQFLQIGTPTKIKKNKKTKNRISSNSSSFRISTTTELKFVRAQLGSRMMLPWTPRVRANQQRSAAELRSSARLKSSSLCVVRARVSLRAGEGETGKAGW
jgi:hypothetical protein